MKRTSSLQRKKPMRRRSKKMEARYAGGTGRRALVARLLKERTVCQAIDKFRQALQWQRVKDPDLEAALFACTVRTREVHEILARSAGGSILDESNALCLCHNCHAWIGKHPRKALALGLRASRYARSAT